MKLFAFTALFLGAVMAAPTNDHGSYNACPNGLYSVEQCCATDVLGVANLDCTSPDEYPRDARNFRDVCSAEGKFARCCVLPVLGQGVLCVKAPGT
ncbi:fungal hydrophobin [Purpureocillium lilacinum]|uniref:Fungal hydrophobin n=2 Tax=Purpureocillium lilacinum TaxID=33203 RepID=A0A179HE08_PURLI|nr:fungal hydrophobin [Purpureocillium lilacinum]OAQ87760.1 fungal hydrophobin domain-containing protein [Purpureocillium lilacinum]PWI71837.1 hydrophobin precursor [Purpureocillium lilacinum]GJN66090.1 fungal hydrophobin [Purpureocillium lilacinum]GJN80035.1 fungal hydrophobin [Purpureocillium lilacinum]